METKNTNFVFIASAVISSLVGILLMLSGKLAGNLLAGENNSLVLVFCMILLTVTSSIVGSSTNISAWKARASGFLHIAFVIGLGIFLQQGNITSMGGYALVALIMVLSGVSGFFQLLSAPKKTEKRNKGNNSMRNSSKPNTTNLEKDKGALLKMSSMAIKE